VKLLDRLLGDEVFWGRTFPDPFKAIVIMGVST